MWQRVFESMRWHRWRGRQIAKRFFSNKHLNKIAKQIKLSEEGHSGEIVVAIEAASPEHEEKSYLRAREVFGRLGVWDTPLNTGVLLYIALDKRCIELIADRGINVPAEQWQRVCQHLQEAFSRQEYFDGVMRAICEIEGLLRDGTPKKETAEELNYLANQPVILP